MTIAEPTAPTTTTSVVFNLYRDIHKGIRAELFAITAAAGRVDPADRRARADLAAHIGRVVELLETHAEHEDASVLPVLEAHLPALAAENASQHETFDAGTANLRALAGIVADGAPDEMSGVYLELAAFTGAYLLHQDFEERVVMPALEATLGVDAGLAIHGEIVGSLTPEETALSLGVMFQAMNVDDRTELLGGMRANAPAEVFAGVWGLVHSVLPAADVAAVGARLGIE